MDEKHELLDQFLARVERPAYRIAEIATRSRDDALDIVQDAMIKLVENYSDKPTDEWRPLFYTILNSRITDYHRRSTLTGRIFGWLGTDEEPEDVATAPTHTGPFDELVGQMTVERLLTALDALPHRQQQVFLLRNWQGFSVRETARLLKCSEGSVKTHLSRAIEALMHAIDGQQAGDRHDE